MTVLQLNFKFGLKQFENLDGRTNFPFESRHEIGLIGPKIVLRNICVFPKHEIPFFHKSNLTLVTEKIFFARACLKRSPKSTMPDPLKQGGTNNLCSLIPNHEQKSRMSVLLNWSNALMRSTVLFFWNLWALHRRWRFSQAHEAEPVGHFQEVVAVVIHPFSELVASGKRQKTFPKLRGLFTFWSTSHSIRSLKVPSSILENFT